MFLWRPVEVEKDHNFENDILCRGYNQVFTKLDTSESEEVTKITGCLKPCKYKQYRLIGEPMPSTFKTEHYVFSLWSVSYRTRVETEQLIYPSSSFVAEFGGTLSLFLGFSFITLWDNLSIIKRFCCLLSWDKILPSL